MCFNIWKLEFVWNDFVGVKLEIGKMFERLHSVIKLENKFPVPFIYTTPFIILTGIAGYCSAPNVLCKESV